MISVEEARSQALKEAAYLGWEKVEILRALGRPGGEEVAASLPHPRWDKSAMDGFALRSSDVSSAKPESPVSLPLSATLTAGDAPGATLGVGEAVRIMTGALLPPGADAVLPLEEGKGEGGQLRVSSPVSPGHCIRRAGAEIKKGQVILRRGQEIRPVHIETLATLGHTHVKVGLRPRVAVLSTGDEVVEPEDGRGEISTLREGQFFCSINYYMGALVLEGGGTPVRMGIAEDRMEAIVERIQQSASADLVIITGGTGKGDKDLVAPAMRQAGAEMIFKDVAMQPGTYSALGRLDRALLFNVPGNPPAAAICFEQFIRPALRCMSGHQDPGPHVRQVRLRADVRVKMRKGLTNFIRGRVVEGEGGYEAVPREPGAPSFKMNALIIVPAGVDQLKAGEKVMAQILSPVHLEGS